MYLFLDYIYLMYFLAANSLRNLNIFMKPSTSFDLIEYGINIDATWLNSSTSEVSVMLPQALLGELRLIVGVHLPLLQMKHESLTACMINISDRKLSFFARPV